MRVIDLLSPMTSSETVGAFSFERQIEYELHTYKPAYTSLFASQPVKNKEMLSKEYEITSILQATRQIMRVHVRKPARSKMKTSHTTMTSNYWENATFQNQMTPDSWT